MRGASIFLADGFEITEALTTVNMLRRGGVNVRIVSIYDDRIVTSSNHIPVTADSSFAEFKAATSFAGSDKEDVMIFPGGMPGSLNLADCTKLMDLMLQHYGQGGSVAAICAAPSVVLSKLPDLEGKTMTCYDGFEPALLEKGVKVTKAGVVTDDRIITSRGAGHAVDFGLAILAQIKDQETADKVKHSIML